jgi:hypothetical protein
LTRLARPAARWLGSGLLVALLLGATWQAWNRHLRDEVFPRRFAEVESDGLYRSG